MTSSDRLLAATEFPDVGRYELGIVQRLLERSCGVVLESDKAYLVETRLALLAERHGHASVGSFLRRLAVDEDPHLERVVVEAMLNGETTFFRDIGCFEAIRSEVLPEILERRRAEKTLNVWSAACSSGQEPYSIAMLFRECAAELEGFQVNVLATDVSRRSLARAAAGRFTQFEVNRGLPARLLVQYFSQDGEDWVIAPEIRDAVEFRELNLVEPWPYLPPMDVVFARNVMIYFDEATKRSVLGRVGDQLRDGGVVVLGATETTYWIDDGFVPVSVPRSCCYRRA